MVEIINGPNGELLLILLSVLTLFGLDRICGLIQEGYEPTVKVGETEISLKKRKGEN